MQALAKWDLTRDELNAYREEAAHLVKTRWWKSKLEAQVSGGVAASGKERVISDETVDRVGEAKEPGLGDPGPGPGPAGLPSGWNMARELSIWNELCRYDHPETVNGALREARRVISHDNPVTLRLFYCRGRRQLYHQARALHEAKVATGGERFHSLIPRLFPEA